MSYRLSLSTAALLIIPIATNAQTDYNALLVKLDLPGKKVGIKKIPDLKNEHLGNIFDRLPVEMIEVADDVRVFVRERTKKELTFKEMMGGLEVLKPLVRGSTLSFEMLQVTYTADGKKISNIKALGVHYFEKRKN